MTMSDHHNRRYCPAGALRCTPRAAQRCRRRHMPPCELPAPWCVCGSGCASPAASWQDIDKSCESEAFGGFHCFGGSRSQSQSCQTLHKAAHCTDVLPAWLLLSATRFNPEQLPAAAMPGDPQVRGSW